MATSVAQHFGLNLKMAKGNFFDRQHVIDRVEAAERRLLSKAGSYVRTRARTSIKRRKAISTPGNPPHAHIKGTDGIKKILFFYEKLRHTVIVGPVKFTSQGDLTVPGLLEYGGRKREEFVYRRNRDRRSGRFTGTVKTRVKVNKNYLARPFMRPALALEAPKFPSLWKDAVR